jgi:predicted dehydrogenase
VRVALVGCGTAAEYYHLPALVSEVGADALWFVDPDVQRARELAAAAGAAPSHAVADASGAAVDAAVIATPSHLHAEIASSLLASGVHVLCEKPLATTADGARRVADAASSSGSVLAVGHFRRFFPTTPLVADLLRRGICGRPQRFAAEEGYVFAWEAQSDYWLDRERAGGGVLADLGPHVLDVLRTWFGPDLAVAAYRDDSLGGVEADCVLELDGPGQGTIECSRTRALRSERRIECENGAIVEPLPQPGELSIEVEGRIHRLHAGGDDAYPAAFRAQLADFLVAARNGLMPTVRGEDGVAVLETIEAAYASRAPLPQPWVTEAEHR